MKKFIPHRYQLEPQRVLRDSEFFGLFMFPGAGKTPLMLEKIYQHKERTLIIAPLDILYTTWQKEPKKWDFSQNLKFTILHGPDKDANFNKNVGVYLINPEGLKWLINKITTTGRFPWTTLIVDESTKFKNPRSKQFEYLSKLLKSFKRRFILSGNPTPNHYLDLWSQIFLLDRGVRLGTSWYQFRDKYFYPADYNRFSWSLRPNAKEEIIQKISDICLFLDPSSELDLPERIIIDHELELPHSVRKKYTQMQKELFIHLDNKYDDDVQETLLVKNATAAAIKCWQIASGFIYEQNEDGTRTIHPLHTTLIDHTQTLVESMQGQPTLIAYNFIEDLNRLAAAFPNARIVASGSKPSDIQAAESDWNNNKIDLLIVHITKFSHGLNLQYGKGNQIIFYGRTYNYDVFDQLIRRFERQGAKYKQVVAHRLIVKNTVHEAIIKSLDSKENMSHSFLTALKEYRDEITQQENNCVH
jgi:SNF2 family DNA or RNA helicase